MADTTPVSICLSTPSLAVRKRLLPTLVEELNRAVMEYYELGICTMRVQEFLRMVLIERQHPECALIPISFTWQVKIHQVELWLQQSFEISAATLTTLPVVWDPTPPLREENLYPPDLELFERLEIPSYVLQHALSFLRAPVDSLNQVVFYYDDHHTLVGWHWFHSVRVISILRQLGTNYHHETFIFKGDEFLFNGHTGGFEMCKNLGAVRKELDHETA